MNKQFDKSFIFTTKFIIFESKSINQTLLINQKALSMKIKLLTLVVFMIFLAGNAFSAADESFNYDKKAIEKEFSDLNQLEQIVHQNPDATFDDLNSQGSLPAELNDLNFNVSQSPLEPPLGIPGFWWGCTLGPIGILIAYLVSDNDKSQAKSALYGCIVQSGAVALIYVIYFVFIIAAVNSGY